MKKLIIFTMMLTMATCALAVNVEIDGLWYEVIPKAKEAHVIQNPKTYKYSFSNVVIPESVESEGITYRVTSIEEYAFTGCRDLTSISIPKSVTSVGRAAFSGCYNLKSVHITDLEAWCRISFEFYYDEEDDYYNVSNPLYYAQQLFLNGVEVKDLTIPSSITSIGPYAFHRFSGLTSVTISNIVTSIGENAFLDCNSLNFIKVCVEDLSAFCNNNIFRTSFGKPIILIDTDGNEIKECIIPDDVTAIGESAFCNCIGLTSITIPNNVTSIGANAFNGCTDLTSITIPASVMSIGDSSFEYCSGLTSITISNNMTSISKGAFHGCSGLTSITIPNSVTSIGDRAFAECIGLTSITIPDGVTSIGEYAFYQCSGLTSIAIPNGVIDIRACTFSGCHSLTSIIIPSSVTSIGNYAFGYCDRLTSLAIPNGVTSIGVGAFSFCSGLTSITIPDDVTSIGGYAFAQCSGLTSITIPNRVDRIGASAFMGCSGLTAITIGSGVKQIGDKAIANCPELIDVYCYAKIVPWLDNRYVFDGSYIEYATLHVPAASIGAYQSTIPWNQFKTIVATDGDMPEEPEIPETPKCATPTIAFEGGKLIFDCETEGVTFVYSFSSASANHAEGNNVSLPSTYAISVYAKKDGYENSDTVTEDIDVRGLIGDMNEDGSLSVTDVTILIDMILKQK